MKTLDLIKKKNLAHAKDQNKPMAVTPKITLWWAKCEKLATTADIMPADLRIASRTNGAMRRAWCLENSKSVLVVSVKDICPQVKVTPDRPENTVRARMQTLTGIKGNTTTKKLGYIRVLERSLALSIHSPKFDPKSPMGKYILANIDKVFIYRQAK